MVIKVANTAFETTPDVKIAVVDVYAPSVPVVPTNSEVATPTVLDSKGVGGFALKESGDLFSTAAKAFKDKNKSLKQAIDEIGSIAKNPREFTEKLSGAVLNDALKSVGYKGTGSDIVKVIKDGPNSTNILHVIGGMSDELKIVTGNVEKMISGKDLGSVNGIASLIGELTGNDDLLKVLNISPKLSVVKSFVDMAMGLRLPEAVDLLVETMDSAEEKRLLKLFSCLNAAMNSDLDFIVKQMNDSSIGVGAILSLYPELPQAILSSYKTIEQPGTKEDATKLIGVLNRLNPNWMRYKRGSVYINDLQCLTTASDDALEILIYDDVTRVPAMLARSTSSLDMISGTLAMRPYTPAKILEGL